MKEQQAAVPPDTGRLLFEIKKVIVGQDHLLERILVALLARGHLLVEGVPGLAKTLAVKTVAQAISGEFKRIQFTPDLVPADLVGTRIYNQRAGDFQTSLGPVFTNLLLADEINRAPAKVQSALLEVMQERQVTIGHASHPVSINLVLAGRALAYLRGRRYVTGQDVQDLALDVLRHRIVLSFEALSEDVSADDVVKRVLARIPVPTEPLQGHVALRA